MTANLLSRIMLNTNRTVPSKIFKARGHNKGKRGQFTKDKGAKLGELKVRRKIIIALNRKEIKRLRIKGIMRQVKAVITRRTGPTICSKTKQTGHDKI